MLLSKNMGCLIEQQQKQNLSIYFLQETHFRVKETQTKTENMEKDISCKWQWQESRGSKTISDKTDIKTKTMTKDK